jgi:hypothetical protein
MMYEKEIPDVVGTIRGYRTWRLEDGCLTSVVYSAHLWEQETTARCLLGGYRPSRIAIEGACSEAPGLECSCGLYAVADPDSYQLSLYAGDDWAELRTTVMGVVELSGVIIEHELHSVMRGQKAQIKAIVLPPGHRWRADRYPGVAIFSDKESLLKAYPPAIERGSSLDVLHCPPLAMAVPLSRRLWKLGLIASVAAGDLVGEFFLRTAGWQIIAGLNGFVIGVTAALSVNWFLFYKKNGSR